MQPQDDATNITAEGAVLCGLIKFPEEIHTIRQYLTPNDFADPIHAETFRLMLNLADRGAVVNPLTLAPLLDQHPYFATTGSYPHLQSLASYDPYIRPLAIQSYAEGLREFAIRRRMATEYANMERNILDPLYHDPETVLADTQLMIEYFNRNTKGREVTDRQALESYIATQQNPPPISPTGLARIDNAMNGGLISAKLYGLAARKKAGKTMLLGTISANLMRQAIPHLLISLEMDTQQIALRKAAAYLGINPRILLPTPSHDTLRDIATYAVQIHDCCFAIHKPGMTLDEAVSAIARLRTGQHIAGCIVDYMQLIGGKPPRQSTAEHLDEIAQRIAELVSKLGIWCLMAAQLNQDGNTRGGEGLRHSCDMYWVLHRHVGTGAHLEMQETRYTEMLDIGGPEQPALWLRNGCYWSEEP